jgi:hypothetical protein
MLEAKFSQNALCRINLSTAHAPQKKQKLADIGTLRCAA